MPRPVSIELRLDSIVYECFLDKKIYNYDQMKPYSITVIQGVLPTSDQNGFQPLMVIMPICENCWKKGVDSKMFKEPSPIQIPSNDQINKIKKKGGVN